MKLFIKIISIFLVVLVGLELYGSITRNTTIMLIGAVPALMICVIGLIIGFVQFFTI